MSEAKTYSGGCHCGKVRYEVKIDLGANLITCNCSMCSRAGTALGFVPEDAFTLKSGEDSLTDYQFNKNVIHHLFCKVCGIKSFAKGAKPDGTKMCAVNVRCLDGVDVSTLKLTPVDGKSR